METAVFDKKRIIGFSDAIFSIAMTLLVLEISIPTFNALNDLGTLELLANRIPSFIGFVVSFLVTALYWIEHMRITKYVSDVDSKLLWLNIFLLLFIVLMPFSTAFYVKGVNLTGPFVFYCFNLTAIGLFNYLMVRYIIKKEKQATGLTSLIGKWLKMRALSSLSCWFLAGLLAFYFPIIARSLFVLIFVFQAIMGHFYKKKLLKSQQHA